MNEYLSSSDRKNKETLCKNLDQIKRILQNQRSYKINKGTEQQFSISQIGSSTPKSASVMLFIGLQLGKWQ